MAWWPWTGWWGGWGRGWRGGWRGPWPGRGPFSHLPPWLRPGWLFGRGACWWLLPYYWAYARWYVPPVSYYAWPLYYWWPYSLPYYWWYPYYWPAWW